VATLEKTEVMSTSTSELVNESISIGNVFPNPTDGAFSFNYTTNESSSINLEVFSMDGKRMYNKLIQVSPGENNISINDFELAGIYFIKLDTGNKVFAQKLIIK